MQNYQRNHEPDQQGAWFDYTGFRFKDMYDIRLKDGRVFEMMRPNGNSWYGYGAESGPVSDDQVAQVRLKPDSELENEYCYTGQERIDHQIYLFGPKPVEGAAK